MNLLNKKVKIKYQKLMEHKTEFSQIYIDFITDNKDTIFTAVEDKTSTKEDIYTFAEDSTWLFWEDDLEIVEND